MIARRPCWWPCRGGGRLARATCWSSRLRRRGHDDRSRDRRPARPAPRRSGFSERGVPLRRRLASTARHPRRTAVTARCVLVCAVAAAPHRPPRRRWFDGGHGPQPRRRGGRAARQRAALDAEYLGQHPCCRSRQLPPQVKPLVRLSGADVACCVLRGTSTSSTSAWPKTIATWATRRRSAASRATRPAPAASRVLGKAADRFGRGGRGPGGPALVRPCARRRPPRCAFCRLVERAAGPSRCRPSRCAGRAAQSRATS
jgi:hypothetical protein